MTILDEMQVLVSDLEAAYSRRVESDRERQAMAARDARDRAAGVRERHGEVADMVEGFFRDRMAMAASEARERAKFERERLAQDRDRHAEAIRDARARAAEFHEFDAIWRVHTGAPRHQVHKADQRPARRPAPASAESAAMKPTPPKPAAAKPAAPDADRSGGMESGSVG